MTQLIRVLIVTDQLADAKQWVDRLQQHGLAPAWLQVDHEADYCAQLHAELDLILTKFALPTFDAPRALQLVQDRGLAIPVIVIAEPGNEEAAFACLRNGAADYLLSDRLVRLGVAASRVVEQRSPGIEPTLAELTWRESLHQAVLRSLTAHLAVLDASATVVLVNKPWEELACEHSLPHTMLARLGGNYLDGCRAVHGENAELAHQMIAGIEAVLNHTEDHFIVEYMRMRGTEELWFVLDVMPLDRNQAGAIIAHKEITSRKRAELALEQERALLSRRVDEQTADLRLANAELARSARLKDEFLANMSHELRTPLNVVLGSTEALQEQVYGRLNHQQNAALQRIEQSGRHLLALINDILDLSKIEAGKMELDPHTVDVPAICRLSLQFIAQQALQKKITLTTSFDPVVTQIMADERRLKQIFVNLLSNAVKFTPIGGRVGVEILADREQQQVHLTVWDTGIGIAPEHLDRLFQPFVQLDSSLSRAYEGTGLGLSLVARLTQLHGGRVKVHSQVGKGSRFTVSLPWAPPAIKVELERSTQLVGATAVARTVVRKVLVVEDSPTATSILTHYLKDLGFTYYTLAQGQNVLRTACAVQPDLIILDILLPDRTGWDILAELQADPLTQAIPVVIVSVMDERVKGLALGARECLVKPVTQDQLAAVLRELAPALDDRGEPARPELVTWHPQAPTILLVEDNPANIMMVAEYLEAKGYRIDIARNGEEALVQTRARRPDLILMDIQMPGMDGLTVTQQLRKEVEFAAIPIIAMTALAMPNDRERCFAAGVDAYLSKPIALQTLTATIEHYLGRGC